MRAHHIIAGSLFAILPLASASAQPPGSRQTREFVQAASESDAFEIFEADSALAESKDPQVIAFARQMIRDHEATGRALRDAAVRAGLALPSMGIGAGQAPFLAALQSEHGTDFDKTYWRQQVLAHRSALVTEQEYASGGDTPAIRAAAAAAVPSIQSHLAMAEAMSAKVDGGS